jgi:phage/conjugal plasmid C-4 type zinc finger TraR family protein
VKVDNAFNLADARAEQERAAGVARVTATISRIGARDCADCGREIPAARRNAAPFARRCVNCQTIHEQEAG